MINLISNQEGLFKIMMELHCISIGMAKIMRLTMPSEGKVVKLSEFSYTVGMSVATIT